MKEKIDLKEWFIKKNNHIDIRIKVSEGKEDEVIDLLMQDLSSKKKLSNLFVVTDIYFEKENLEEEIKKLEDKLASLNNILRG